MARINCEKKESFDACTWPDCGCTWAPKAVTPSPMPQGIAGMYAGTDHQKADPDRLRAIVEREYGLEPAVPARRVIPIAAAADQPPPEQLFDADMLEIMLREAGALPIFGTESSYDVDRETMAKLAIALNNLPS